MKGIEKGIIEVDVAYALHGDDKEREIWQHLVEHMDYPSNNSAFPLSRAQGSKFYDWLLPHLDGEDLRKVRLWFSW